MNSGYNNAHEIQKIKCEILELQKRLETLESKRTLAEMCKNEPYTAIIYDNEYGIAYFSKRRSNVWNAMREVSKELFIIDNNLQSKPYDCICEKPRKVKEMTPKQQEIAAKFLDECISLYNKYFVEINKHIILDGKPYTVTQHE